MQVGGLGKAGPEANEGRQAQDRVGTDHGIGWVEVFWTDQSEKWLQM
jgi:hypothetical protein